MSLQCQTMVSKLPIRLTHWISATCPECRRKLPILPSRRNIRPFSSSRPKAIAAPPIDFSSDGLPPPNTTHARLVPESPSYFTAKPRVTDDLLHLLELLRRYQHLPTVPPGQAPRVAWRTVSGYRLLFGEEVKTGRYHKVIRVLQRLNQIHPSVMTPDLREGLEVYKRDIDPYAIVPTPGTIDEDGKAYGIGRRKSSSAKVYLVQGEGQVLVNGKSINNAFGRLHDRESALWALKATDRLDKYNVWALVSGGGTTGQAEAITLGAARALMVHEPLLKAALRRGKVFLQCHDRLANLYYQPAVSRGTQSASRGRSLER